jgi:taurine dioxygenase
MTAMPTAAAQSPSPHPFRLRLFEGGLGAEVEGITVSAIDDATFPTIYDAFLKHQLLLFRDLDLPPGDQVAFARRFGEVQVHVMNQYHAIAYPELYTLSNLGPDGKPSGKHPDRGTMAWHTDGSWQRRTTKATMLYAEVIPSKGGGTGFADMYSAFEAMRPDEQRRLEAMRAVHNLDFSRNRRHGDEPMTDAQRKAVPPVEQPVIEFIETGPRPCISATTRRASSAWATMRDATSSTGSTSGSSSPAGPISTTGGRATSWSGTIAA